MVKRHQSRLSAKVHSTGTLLAERFEAARLLIGIGAVLVQFSTVTGICFRSADMVLPPKSWICAAQEAVAERRSVLQWVNIQPARLPDRQAPVPVMASTIGLAALLGRDVAIYLARIAGDAAIRTVRTACMMPGQQGHKFGEDGSPERYRIGFQSEGLQGAQADIWALLHRAFPIGEMELFGTRLLRPLPPGMHGKFRGDDGWLTRVVGRVRA